MRTFVLLLALTLPVLWPATTAAQELGQVAREFARNIDALKGYTWQSKVVYSVDGKVSSTDVYRITHGTDGSIRRELVSSEGKRSKPEDTAELALSSIRDLIDAYVNMSPDKFHATFASSPRWVIPGKDGEPTRIKASNVIHTGDTMEIWVDPTSYRLQRIELETDLQAEPARLLAQFATTDDDVSYVSKSTFYTHHKSKSVEIETQNYDIAPEKP